MFYWFFNFFVFFRQVIRMLLGKNEHAEYENENDIILLYMFFVFISLDIKGSQNKYKSRMIRFEKRNWFSILSKFKIIYHAPSSNVTGATKTRGAMLSGESSSSDVWTATRFVNLLFFYIFNVIQCHFFFNFSR